jgi:hypothetical protein
MSFVVVRRIMLSAVENQVTSVLDLADKPLSGRLAWGEVWEFPMPYERHPADRIVAADARSATCIRIVLNDFGRG